VRSISPPTPAASRNPSLIDLRIRQYADQQLPREAILERLLAARWPLEQLKSRFPEFPDSAFHHPAVKSSADIEAAGEGDRGGRPHTAHASPIPPSESPRSSQPSRVAAPAHPHPRPIAASVSPPTVTPSVDRAIKQAESAVEGISFQYVPLIQCSFPHADPKHATMFTRRNGWLELTLGTTRPEIGLPYGVPARLLTIYCTSEAVRTQSPEIFLGDSVHDFLRRLDVPITRGARGSLSVYANQLLRLIHSTVSIDENIRDGAGRSGLHIRQALFVEEAQLWWDEPQDPNRAKGRGDFSNGSSLTLSSVLFHSILERSAPLATHAIKRLRKSPMDLDVYAWLVHRLFHLGKPSLVSWSQLSNQFGHNYELPRKFRQFFLGSLKRVALVYPEAKLKVSDAGILLLPSRPHVAHTKSLTRI
jgi:hypothetical protein